MKSITSRHNPLFKRIREAAQEHAGEIVIEGPKQVADALSGGWTPIALVERENALPFEPAGGDHGAERVSFSNELFDALAQTATPQGVLGLFQRPASNPAEIFARRDTIVVALDAVQDPGNVGTIVRLAAAFDAAGVLLLPGCADPFGPKAIRASVGAVLGVRMAQASAEELLASGLPLFAAAADGERSDPPARGAILVFGSEGRGVSEEILAAAQRIAVPMSPRVESLNVASSAAILLSRSYALR